MSKSGTPTELAVVDAGDLFRVYTEVGKDGYPPEWHETVKHAVREHAEHRCVRCLHPYRTGEHPMEDGVSWSRCDYQCAHRGPLRARHIFYDEWLDLDCDEEAEDVTAGRLVMSLNPPIFVEARARILTVHHLDGDKANCRWWNLASLCQRCHLTIQGRVQLHRVYPWEHSEWFKPYAAGWYAHAYLNEDLTREQTVARLDELLALELSAA